MKKLATGLLAGTATMALSMTMLPPSVATPSGPAGESSRVTKPDNRPGPLTEKQDALRSKAVQMIANGSAKMTPRRDGGATVRIESGPDARGGTKGKPGTEFVEFPVNRTDHVLSMLGEFSDMNHNEIPEPDRRQDNSTYWEPDFSKAHYDELFMGDRESFRDYYKKQSGGRYEVTLTTEDWVKVPGTQAAYGGNDVEERGGAWQFVTDTANSWYAGQRAAGKSDAEIRDYLSQFDEWDRYDADGDGNFNEPDGYVDHFQAIHAGEGEEAGASPDAIWSHRWYVNPGDFGTTGPEGARFGGTQIGNTGLWIGDYTVEPENGGLGVFAHEYAHDLGLPDYYDTAGGDNSVAFWSLMSSGSWLGHGARAKDGIGTTPGGFGPQEKLELGWLDYSEVNAGEQMTTTLAPSQNTYDDPATERNEADQAVKVNLPEKTTSIPYTTPPEGEHAWWSGRADGTQATLTREIPASASVTITAQAWHQIEEDYDFLYLEQSTDGGATWTNAAEPISSDSNGWEAKSWTYAPEGGAASLFRFRYATDTAVNEAGVFLDAITITAGGTTITDGAENGDNGWDVSGWTISTGTDTKVTPQYYLLENRQYVGYDKTLGEGPYNFSKGITKPNWVEFFKFHPGMVVWYVDFAYADNNTSATPGHGAVLPVDARPKPMTWSDGTKPTNRRQPFDAAFGLDKVKETCLHKEVESGDRVRTLEACAPKSRAMPTFNDSDPDRYWDASNPMGSTKVAGVGVKATVVKEHQGHLTVRVSNP